MYDHEIGKDIIVLNNLQNRFVQLFTIMRKKEFHAYAWKIRAFDK